ncbi:hypothetical protein F5883DRAFT_588278 [Diaporthe sp. PMI_573]|nr:hypothetical protein F5883DRAFT_588278 [Diaporthaceae sp. PMI_573]
MMQQNKAQSSYFSKIDKSSSFFLTLLVLWLLILLAFFLLVDIHLASLVALGISSVIFAMAVAIAAVIAQWPKNSRGPMTARHPTIPFLGHTFGVLGMTYYSGAGFNAAPVMERGGAPAQHRPELNNTRKPQSQSTDPTRWTASLYQYGQPTKSPSTDIPASHLLPPAPISDDKFDPARVMFPRPGAVDAGVRVVYMDDEHGHNDEDHSYSKAADGMRHTRVYGGGGVCLACAAAGGGGFFGARVRPEDKQ